MSIRPAPVPDGLDPETRAALDRVSRAVQTCLKRVMDKEAQAAQAAQTKREDASDPNQESASAH